MALNNINKFLNGYAGIFGSPAEVRVRELEERVRQMQDEIQRKDMELQQIWQHGSGLWAVQYQNAATGMIAPPQQVTLGNIPMRYGFASATGTVTVVPSVSNPAALPGEPPRPAALSPYFNPQNLDDLKAIQPRRVFDGVPDMVTMITAWRAWKVQFDTKTDTPYLFALGSPIMWPAKEKMAAICLASNSNVPPIHEAPNYGCMCGMWGFKSLERLIATMETIAHYHATARIIGTVNMWGRVIETENGFRAQYAYPKELWLLDADGGMEKLSSVYQVPIRSKRITELKGKELPK